MRIFVTLTEKQKHEQKRQQREQAADQEIDIVNAGNHRALEIKEKSTEEPITPTTIIAKAMPSCQPRAGSQAGKAGGVKAVVPVMVTTPLFEIVED